MVRLAFGWGVESWSIEFLSLIRMSGQALRDLNTLPVSERKNESSGKGSLAKPYIVNGNINIDNCQRKNPTFLASTPVNDGNIANTVLDGGALEVEYVESENLNDLEDVNMCLSTLLGGLDSKDWVLVCEALNNVRRLSIFHREAMLDTLGKVILLIVKSLKNPRSAICKTAVMTSEDIFNAYGDHIIDSLDPLLVQLLLKSSQDKRFVCEAAERALVAMTTRVSPILLLPKLQPYLKHKNPRIRAKASMCFCWSVPRLCTEGIKAFGIDKLIQISAAQLSDQLPESREAARSLLLKLQTVYEKSCVSPPAVDVENSEMGSWEHFCQLKLSPLSAQAVLRVTNIARDGGVVGS
ncbi:CLASP N-terminal domain [Macleaya cordata]|uniref:CLASP N-terminal domain n=1 Tax=Macleaya cordata TaxID=56857 RepID=A0A200R798_MACCD|nr:CLASP N-terminal domain [Macleaya cordata]